MLRQLDELGGDVKGAVQNALTQASETIAEDTEDALVAANLPRRGEFSHGATKESIIQDHAVRWEGLVGWVPVGFDFSKPGAGGFLISGSPRMQPVYQLRKMYKQKKYMAQIQNDIGDVLADYVVAAMDRS